MNLDLFIDKIAEQFEETDSSLIASHTEFKELEEWSSLMSLTLIGMIDEEFDVIIKGEDIRKAETIEDLYNIVNSKK